MLCVVVWGVCGGCVRFCRQRRACCRGEVRALNDAPVLPSRDKTARLVRAAFGEMRTESTSLSLTALVCCGPFGAYATTHIRLADCQRERRWRMRMRRENENENEREMQAIVGYERPEGSSTSKVPSQTSDFTCNLS